MVLSSGECLRNEGNRLYQIHLQYANIKCTVSKVDVYPHRTPSPLKSLAGLGFTTFWQVQIGRAYNKNVQITCQQYTHMILYNGYISRDFYFPKNDVFYFSRFLISRPAHGCTGIKFTESVCFRF